MNSKLVLIWDLIYASSTTVWLLKFETDSFYQNGQNDHLNIPVKYFIDIKQYIFGDLNDPS